MALIDIGKPKMSFIQNEILNFEINTIVLYSIFFFKLYCQFSEELKQTETN